MMSVDLGPRAIAACALLGLTLSCSRAAELPVSTVPLGLGPLGLAEQAAEKAEEQASNDSARLTAAAKEQEDSLHLEPDEEVDDDWDNDAWGDDSTQDNPEQGSTGDESESDNPSPASFDGLFSGEDVAIFRFPGRTKQRQEDPNAQIRVELGELPSIRLVLINSDTGEDLCSLEAEIDNQSGGLSSRLSAHLVAGQPCFTAEGSALSAVITSGRALLRHDKLTLKAVGDLQLSGGEQVLTGHLRYSFSGERE